MSRKIGSKPKGGRDVWYVALACQSATVYIPLVTRHSGLPPHRLPHNSPRDGSLLSKKFSKVAPQPFAMCRTVPAICGARPSPGPWPQLCTTMMSSRGRELLMLPRCVLGVPPRGGRKHAKASAAYTLDRLHQWQHGERQSLWDSRGSLGGRHHKQPSAAEKRSLATALAREGFDRKACNALLSQGLCPQTAATTQALQALHPAQPPPTTRPLAAQTLSTSACARSHCESIAELSRPTPQRDHRAFEFNIFGRPVRPGPLTLCCSNFAAW